MTKDTAWSLESLEQYRDAWQVFKQPITPGLTERKFTILNWQLQVIIDAAKDAALEVTLIGLKKRAQWPRFIQRRVLVGGRKCVVYCCTRLSPDPTAPPHNFVFLRSPTNKWAEFQLCIVKDGPNEHQIFVIPRGAIQKQTTVSLDNPTFQSYKNNWKLLTTPVTDLAVVIPIQWRPPKIAPRPKEVPVALAKTMLQAQSHGLSVEPLPAGSAGKGGIRVYISHKRCQIMEPSLVTMGSGNRKFVPLNIPKSDWAEFLVFFVRAEIDSETPKFYVMPRTRLIKATLVSPTSSWLREYQDAWHLLR